MRSIHPSVPDWLQQALQQTPVLSVAEPQEAPVAPGQIRWAHSRCGSHRQLVLVLEADRSHEPLPRGFIHPAGQHASVCFLDDETDLAADGDAVLYPAETGLPFQLLAHAHLLGPVAYERLGGVLAQVSPELVDALHALSWRHASPLLEGRRGLPIRSDEDARYAYNLRCLDQLRLVLSNAEEMGIE